MQGATKLEKAGCHVIYGLTGLKTHCKICLVVRKDKDGIRRYLHMGTGNYNDSTARFYTDIGMFTCREEYGVDASSLFNVLTGYSTPPEYNKFIVAPIADDTGNTAVKTERGEDDRDCGERQPLLQRQRKQVHFMDMRH